MSGVRIDVEARTSKAEQDLASINASLRNIEKTTAQTGASLKNLFSSLGALATAGLAVNYIKNVSTEFANLGNKIATVTGRTKELVQTQEALFKIAEDTRGSLQGTVTTFASFGRSLKATGVSTEKILQATKTVQEAIALSGSSAESAAAALIQLGQGIASGALRGEELNSVLEQTPRIAQAISDELKVNLGQLRLIAAEGKLTSSVVFNALLNQSKQINKEFGDLAPTLAQANSLLGDSLKIYVSELDKGLGLTESVGLSTFKLAKSIKAASANAFELGTRISFVYNQVTGAAKSILSPIAGVFKELGKQFLQIIPNVTLSRTLKRDLQESLIAFDKFTGGLLTSFNRFSIVDLISVESDVEEAIKKLKRLSPTYWAGAGFNRATFERFFSKENLNAYAGAFQDLYIAVAGNTNAIGGQLTKFFKQLDTGFKNIARYFGFRLDTIFVFTGGNLENFLTTLTDIARGLAGVSIKFFEVGKLATYYLAPSIKGLVDALKDAVPVIVKSVGVAITLTLKAVYEFVKAAYAIIYEFTTSFSIKSSLETAFESVTDFFDGLRNKANLSDIIRKIEDFGEKVIEVFFDIYDKVIGNSWWTDTIDSIIDTSNTLWDKASAGLNKFKTNTINIFKNIFDNRRRLNFDFADIKSIDFSFTSFKLPKLETRDWAEAFVNFADSAKQTFKDLFEAFPSIAKAALVGVAGILIATLFPAGVIKNVLLAGIFTSLATSTTLIAEQFGAALTGGSFVSALGYKLGQAAGFFVRTLIEELPSFLNALLGVVSSFVRGFAEQLPIIGNLISGIFNISDVVGVSGPLGLLGAFLFGKIAANTLKTIGIGKDAIESIETLFGKFTSIVTGNSDGFISKFIFGKLGAVRTVSIVGLLLSTLGAFDSIFSESILAQYALQGGLIYTSLFGQAGLDKITDAVGGKIIAPISESLKDFAKIATANTLLYDVFFGDTGTWAERASVALKSVLDKISKKIIDAATPFVEKGFDFVKTLLLGTRPEVTINAVKRQIAAVATVATIQLETLKQRLSQFNLSGLFSGSLKNGLEKLVDSVKAVFATASGGTRGLTNSAARVGGETGLLGRLIFGKAGKFALIAGVLTLFATAASAAEKTAPKLKEQSVFQDILDNWNAIKLENPFAAIALQVTGVAIPLIIGALIFFRQRVLSLISSAFGISSITNWATATISSITSVAAKLKNIGIIGGAGALAGGITYAATQNTEAAVSAALLAGQIALMFRKKIAAALVSAFQFVFVRLGGTILKFVFSVKGAIILLLTSAITAFIDWFFGLDLASRAKAAINKVKAAIGFDTKEPSKTTGLSTTSEDFARSRNLPVSYSLEGINFKNISGADSERLQKAIGKLEETIKASIDEEEQTGRVSPDTRDSIRDLDKGLNNLIPKIESRSAFNTEDFLKTLQNLRNLTPTSPAQRASVALQQGGLDAAFRINEALIKTRRFFSGTPEGKLRATQDLEQLQSERDTRFNARFRPLDQNAEEIAKLSAKVKDLKFPDGQLAKEINNLQQQYLDSFQAVADAEKNIFGLYRPLPATDQRVVRRDLLGEQLRNASLKQIGIDQANQDIQEFQGRLGSVSSNLKAIGADFKIDELFAINDESFKNIERLSDSAKQLAEQLKLTKTVAEQNEIIYRITEIKTQVLEFKLRSEEGGPLRKQPLLKAKLEQAGVGIFSDATLKSLSDDAAENLFKLANSVILQEEQLRRKLPGPMQSLKPGDDSWLGTIKRYFGGAGLTKEQQEAVESYDAGRKALEAAIKNLRNSVVGEAKGATSAAIPVLQDLAASLSLDFNELVKNRGFDQAAAGIKRLLKLNDDLQEAIRSNSTGQVQSLTKQIDRLKEDLQQAPKTLQDLVNNISGLGNAITLEDLSLLKPEQLRTLQEVSMAVNGIEKDLTRLGETATKTQIDEIVARKLDASQKAFKIYLETLYSTGEKTLQALTKFGISDLFDVSNLSNDLITQFLDIDKQVVNLQEKLKDKSNSSRFAEIVSELVRAQREAERLKRTIANFDVRSEAINKAFGLNLSDRELARLGDKLIIQLSSEAQTALANIEDLKRLPMERKLTPSVQVFSVPEQGSGKQSQLVETVTYPAQGTDRGVSAKLLEAFENIRKRSAEVGKSSEILNAIYQQNISEIATLPLDKLVENITTAFPALADFKDSLVLLTRKQLDSLAILAAGVEDTKRRANLGLVPQSAVTGVVESGTNTGQKSIGAVSFGADIASRLKVLGIEIDKEAYNLVTAWNNDVIGRLTSRLEAAIKERNRIISDPTSSQAARIAAQNLVNDAKVNLSEGISKATFDIRQVTRDAGKEFSSSITSSWTSALTEYLSGRTTWKEFTKSILTSFTDQVIKTFVEGLMQPLTGENGLITKYLRPLGSSIFSAFKSGQTGSIGETTTAAIGSSPIESGENTSIFSNLTAAISSSFASFTSIFATQSVTLTTLNATLITIQGTIVTFLTTISTFLATIETTLLGILTAVSIEAALPFATGGRVVGPGSGTSDSILARLSNGEFIINAESTKKFRPVLEAINSNRIKAFAAGGLVTSSMMATPTVADIKSINNGQSSNSQVINISITGDISRQTRSEVYRMLPSIAEGVNLHNKEKGYRG